MRCRQLLELCYGRGPSIAPSFDRSLAGRSSARRWIDSKCGDGQGGGIRPPDHAEFGLVLLILPRASGSADLPDHAGPGNLNEWTVASDLEPRVRVRLPEVPHRTVIHEVSAVVGSKLEIHRAVDPSDLGHERLLERLVEGKPLKRELEGLTGFAEVDELDVVPFFRRAIGFREPEVPLSAGKGCAALDR